MSDTKKYWGSLPTNEFGKTLIAKLDVAVNSPIVAEIRAEQANAFEALYGLRFTGAGPSSSMVERVGPQGSRAEFQVANARSLAQNAANIITQPKISWNPEAQNSDVAPLSQTMLAVQWLDHVWKNQAVGPKVNDAVFRAIPYGEAFVWAPWSPSDGPMVVAAPGKSPVREGDIRFVAKASWEIIRDPSKKGWDKLDWIAVMDEANRYDLIAMFPDQTDKILSTSAATLNLNTPGTQDGRLLSDSEDIPYRVFYHKCTPALPRGRETWILLDGTVLYDDALSPNYDEWPVARMSCGEIEGTPWPMTSFWQCLAIEEIASSLHSSITTNLTTISGGLLAVESDMQLDPQVLAGGPTIIPIGPGGKAPVAINLQTVDPMALNYLQQLDKIQARIMNVHDVNRGGLDPKLSGAALALLSAMAIQANSDLQTLWLAFVEQLGSIVLKTYATRLTRARKIAISGKSNSSLVTYSEVKKSDLQGIGVHVSVGNALLASPAGRQQVADQLLAKGFIKVGEQYMTALLTGELEPLTNDLRQELMLIADENERLRKGEVPQASVYDDQSLHLRGHRAEALDPEARKDPKRIEAIQSHMSQHIQLATQTDPAVFMAMGMQPIQQPQPPQPAGPAPQPGPPVSQPGVDTPGEEVPLPNLPKNPMTGAPWNPVTGGGPEQ